jgi:Zn2+/Cd2+-exporting ATPase
MSGDTCNNSTPCSPVCGCAHESYDLGIRNLIIRTVIACVLVAISIIVELGTLKFPWIAIVTSLAALALTAYPILKEAIQGLLRGERNVCELASLAIIGAVIIGEFTTAAEIAIILTIGEVIEGYAYARTKRDLENIITENPRFGTVIRDGQPTQVPVGEIKTDDIVMVRPGDKIPVDGTIIEGHSSFDESCLTGESLPLLKGPGYPIYSGSINQEGTIMMKATKVAVDSTYSRIVQLVHDAGLRRPPSNPVIDRFSRIYTPIMLIITVIVFIITGSYIRAITVLIVACPCALLLSTPSAILASLGVAAKNGILIKGGEFLEICHSVTTIVMDKTGTLTSGKMVVTRISPIDNVTEIEVLETAATAEHSSSHPVARAIVQAAEDKHINVIISSKSRNHPGLGVTDTQNGRVVHVGNLTFIRENGIDIPDPLIEEIEERDKNSSIKVMVSVDLKIIGVISLSDQIRPESKVVISSLKSMGIGSIHLLTGDNQNTGLRVASVCGIDINDVHSGMHPEDKEEFIANLQNKGDIVCYIGDGTNDGPALARADLGVSIGSREDTIALETSNVILMKGDLASFPFFVSLGRRTARMILVNIGMALTLNILLILGAAIGLLSPALGAIGHQVATVLVLLNSSRLAIQPDNNSQSKSHFHSCECKACLKV